MDFKILLLTWNAMLRRRRSFCGGKLLLDRILAVETSDNTCQIIIDVVTKTAF
jgi:hypothetical protein